MKLGERIKSMGMFPDMGKLTDMFNQKFDALIAKLDEILVELRKQNAGQLGVIVGVGIVILVLAIIGLLAVCTPGEDDHSLGRVQLASHGYDGGYDDGGDCDWSGQCGDGDEYRHDYSNHDRNRNRNRDRGAFSPGPFRDSPVTICAPYSCNSGGEQSGGNREDRRDEPPPDERI
jgi:hypothetical protein